MREYILSEIILDKLDQDIIQRLVADARTSARTLGEDLGKSPTTIANRIKKLEEHGVISNYEAQIDYQKLGFDWVVIIEVIVSKGQLVETENEIAKLDYVVAVYDVTGTSDIIVIGRFQTREQLSLFTKRLLAMEYVDRTISHIALNTVKEDFNFKSQMKSIRKPK